MSWNGYPYGGVDYANYAGQFNPKIWANRGIDFAVVKIDGGGRERSPQTHPWAAVHVPQLVDAGVPFVGGYCVTRPGKIPEQVGYALERASTLFGGLEGTIIQQDVERWEDSYGTPTYAEAVRWAELWHAESGGHPLALYYPKWVLGNSGHNLFSDWPPGTALWASDYSASHVQEKLRPYGGFPRVSILQYAGSISIAGIAPVDANLINTQSKVSAYALLDQLGGKGKVEDDMDDRTVIARPANVNYAEGNNPNWETAPATSEPTLGAMLHMMNNSVRESQRSDKRQEELLGDIKELLTEISGKVGTVELTPDALQALQDGLADGLASGVSDVVGADLRSLATDLGNALDSWVSRA